jgi:ABC-type nitrate/sulfonate/bicarbonate transport system substrate-binding protein
MASGWRFALSLGVAVCTAVHVAAAQPVPLRMGTGPASEEQLWLIKARPDLTPNQGKVYSYNLITFRGGNERFQAYQSGQLDGASSSSTGALFAASKGIDLRVILNMGNESNEAFSTTYLAMADKPIAIDGSLKGKTIGLNGFRQSLELWARIAVQKAGLNPERDVQWTVVPLPQMGDALRAGKIDVGVFPQPFAHFEQAQGGVKTLFTAASIGGIEEEFDVYFSPDYTKKHPQVMRAFVSDFIAVTKFVRENPKEARQALLDAKIVQIPAAVYLNLKDLNRHPQSLPQKETFRKAQELMIKVGFQETPVDVDKIVDTSFHPPR